MREKQTREDMQLAEEGGEKEEKSTRNRRRGSSLFPTVWAVWPGRFPYGFKTSHKLHIN